MPSPTTVERFAPAKVNLTLHVTGRRADGYHLLDSLVVFVGVGDRVRASAAPALTLAVAGPLAKGVPSDGSNLMLRAAQLFDPAVAAALDLEKHLPVASGIGGGSADAAATLLCLAELAGGTLPNTTTLLSLGADLPVCLHGRPVRMRGIGERLDILPPLPPAWLVLANPGVTVATADVYAGLLCRESPPMDAPPRQGWQDTRALAHWLAAQRNDLEAPARARAPLIGRVTDSLLAAPGCLIARMSGSGATCFGLFASAQDARSCAGQLRAAQPDWWVAAAPILS